MAQAKSVADIYKSVVNDVIEGVKEAFMEDSLDETVLQELRQLWESKLAQSKAVEPPEHDVVYTRPTPAAASMATAIQIKQQQPMATQLINPVASAVSAASHQQQQPIQGQIFNITPAHQLVSRAVRLPVQTNAGQTSTITLPVQGAGAFQQHLTSLQYLVPNQPGQFLIQTPNGARLIQSQQGLPPGAVLTVAASSTNAGTGQGMANKTVNQSIIQLDGLNDSSSEEEEEEEEDEDEEQNEENDDAQGEEEDPLCSDDDISDTDPTEVFDAENVVVCQFDKINRSKNKWKFHLKDGIMNLNGKDHVFQKANGDAEW